MRTLLVLTLLLAGWCGFAGFLWCVYSCRVFDALLCGLVFSVLWVTAGGIVESSVQEARLDKKEKTES